MAKYESSKVGDTEFSHVSFPLIVEKFPYAFDDLDASFTLTIPVEPGNIILGVGHEVTTQFAGGTPTVKVGDGSTADYYLTTTACAATTLNVAHSLGSGVSVSTGSTTPKKVVVTGSTQLSAGEGVVYIFRFDTNTNWRTSGQF